MSEAKHTPGPWKVEAVFINQPSEPALHFGEYVLKLSDMMKGVKPTEFALCLTLSREVAEANPRLIAAAPDLLAALKRLHGLVESTARVLDGSVRETPQGDPLDSIEYGRAAYAQDVIRKADAILAAIANRIA